MITPTKWETQNELDGENKCKKQKLKTCLNSQ